MLGIALERGRALLIAINKWDGIPIDKRDQIRNDLALRLNFVPFAPQHFISARHGTGVGELATAAVRAYDASMRAMPTPQLSRVMEKAIEAHQPPLVQGRRIKLRYAHQGGKNPPRIIVHGNQTHRRPRRLQALSVECVPRGVRPVRESGDARVPHRCESRMTAREDAQGTSQPDVVDRRPPRARPAARPDRKGEPGAAVEKKKPRRSPSRPARSLESRRSQAAVAAARTIAAVRGCGRRRASRPQSAPVLTEAPGAISLSAAGTAQDRPLRR